MSIASSIRTRSILGLGFVALVSVAAGCEVTMDQTGEPNSPGTPNAAAQPQPGAQPAATPDPKVPATPKASASDPAAAGAAANKAATTAATTSPAGTAAAVPAATAVTPSGVDSRCYAGCLEQNIMKATDPKEIASQCQTTCTIGAKCSARVNDCERCCRANQARSSEVVDGVCKCI